jgi:hypothetical protein
MDLAWHLGHSRSKPAGGNFGFSGIRKSTSESLIWEWVNSSLHCLHVKTHLAIGLNPANGNASRFGLEYTDSCIADSVRGAVSEDSNDRQSVMGLREQ